jgi:hypothetical protein
MCDYLAYRAVGTLDLFIVHSTLNLLGNTAWHLCEFREIADGIGN